MSLYSCSVSHLTVLNLNEMSHYKAIFYHKYLS